EWKNKAYKYEYFGLLYILLTHSSKNVFSPLIIYSKAMPGFARAIFLHSFISSNVLATFLPHQHAPAGVFKAASLHLSKSAPLILRANKYAAMLSLQACS